MGFLTYIWNGLLKIVALILVIAFIPGIPPYMEFEAYSLKPPRPLEGGLAVNEKLNNAEKLFINEIKGPEHLEVYDNELYTSLAGGYVVKVVDDKIVPIIKFGNKCDGLYESEICGRPLGLRFDSKGFMYVADAYYGIFRVNVTSGESNQLVSMRVEINGAVPKIPNSVTVAKDGSVYWTDSSTSHALHDGLYTVFGNGNGRLIKYNPETKSNTVLIDKLFFANGVALSEDESFVLVCELFKSRILRYNLKGPKQGQTEVFLDNLPGYPDNMHSDKKGGFFVTLVSLLNKENPGIPYLLGPYPNVRRFLARLIYLLQFPFLQMNYYYPNEYSKIYSHWIGSLEMLQDLVPTSHGSAVVFFNEEAVITKSLFCTDGKTHSNTDIAFFNNYYYLGSFFQPYLARVKAS